MNNEILASLYDERFPQLIIIDGVAWKHIPGGNWFIYHAFGGKYP